MTHTPLHRMDDDELGRSLTALDLAWPEPAADLGPRVRTAIADRPWRPSARSRATRAILIAAAIVLLLAAAAVAAKLVIDLGAITIEPIPTGRPLPSETTLPDPGQRVTLAEAEALTGTSALVPTALVDPDRVWVDVPEDVPAGAAPNRIVMAWLPRRGLPAIPGSGYGAVLIRWDANVAFGAKLVGEEFRRIEVPGWGDGYWVTEPHELVLFGEDGPQPLLVRGHVLLWGDDRTTFRLESHLSEDRAVAVAATTP
jgi:hypothetical protein